MKNVLLLLFGVLFSAISMDFFDFVNFAYSDNDEILGKYDAIVVLTGGVGRIDGAMELIKQGKAEVLFISGVNKNVSFDEFLTTTNIDKKLNLKLGYTAKNTYQNGLEVMDFVNENKAKNIILVTSAYHLPRAMFELKLVGKKVEIMPYRIFAEGKDAKKWWKQVSSLRLVLVEYSKYVVARLGKSFL